MGIDPGYGRLGIAVIERSGGETLLYSECFTTKAGLPFALRLKEVGGRVKVLIKKWKPDRVALESLFFSKNQKTAMEVSATRGVIMYEARNAGLPVFEYTPVEIKVATTGYGRSDKRQIKAMVDRLIAVHKKIAYDDEYDAIATALTCAAREKTS